MLEIDQIAICNREAAKSLERSRCSFEGSQIQSIPFHASYLASHFTCEIPRRWLETITFPMIPWKKQPEAPEKWAKIASKRTFPQLRPLEFAVSSRAGFRLSVSSSQHIFCIHALWWPRSVYAFSGLARQEQELVWKGPDVRNLEGRESWKDMGMGRLTKQRLPLVRVKNPWFFPLANGIVAELLPENSHHWLSSRISHPLKSSYASDASFVEDCIQRVWDEVSGVGGGLVPRVMKLPGFWEAILWNFRWIVHCLGWRRMMTFVGLEGRAAI